MWSGSSRAQEPREAVGEDGEVRWRNVGDIGWDDEVLSDGYSGSGRKVWNLIPLVHDFALHKPPSYDPSALRLLSHSHNPHSDQKNDAEHEGEGSQERVRVEATSTGGFTRWKFDVQRGEEVYLKTRVRTDCTNEIYNFFLGSAISLARQYGVDVPSLRLGQPPSHFPLCTLCVGTIADDGSSGACGYSSRYVYQSEQRRIDILFRTYARCEWINPRSSGILVLRSGSLTQRASFSRRFVYKSRGRESFLPNVRSSTIRSH
ncbi:hypothetical protein SISSUDRAFT_424593 [Sistotremastrum suecicum HHB10207 ss-3]|uniref:Uncharacterized protein n=1 Tax=Sistotremastrum suecicum HHB10207 ss-3 TaxID=1314776 RepID=A0A165YIE5_9AGAM|nr:hypothetical protein SISSUDRAFT_424593 [Sistotremastrum suecicum HHB10207 ss-3]